MQVFLPLRSSCSCHVITLLACVVMGWCCLAQASNSACEEQPCYYSIKPGSPSVKVDALRRIKREFKDDGRNSPFTGEENKMMLDKHNELRGITKNAADMVMLEWDDELQEEAQRWADRCDFNHPKEKRIVGRFRGIGQNLYVATNEPARVDSVVQSWYDEIKDYTYSSNMECKPGRVCGHYTQVVWAKSEAVGCAMKYCDSLTSVPSFNKGYLVVCEYGPPGNYLQQYPYKKGKACSACPEKYKHCTKNLCSLRPYIGSENQTNSVKPRSSTPLVQVIAFVTVAVIVTLVQSQQ